MQFKPVTHILFDIDGLLLDTEGLYEEIIGNICKKFGGEYTEEVRQNLLGRKEQDCAAIVVKEAKLNCTPDEFTKNYIPAYLIGLKNAKLLPGAEKLIRHLAKCNVPMALATSSSRDSVVSKTSDHQELFKLFHHLVSGTSDSEVKESKPAPDIFLICAAKFPENPLPEKCLVFEDSPSGVKAGIAGGMQVVMVPDPRVGVDKQKEATQVLKSLEDFKPEDFGLPPYSIN